MKQEHHSESITRWHAHRREWDPDPHKPFFVEVLKKAIFTKMVDFVFLRHFKNSLALMCEAWLKRNGIDPTINTSKNFHNLQDEFFKVLAHINRGFECAVHADWRAGVGSLISLRRDIDKKGEAQWFDHEMERRKGDPASQFELIEEPRQDVADAYWIDMFKKGRRIKEQTLDAARDIDQQQARFFASIIDIEEYKTFTETKLHLITNTQESWVNTSLSSKLGLKKGWDFLEDTFATSIEKLREAESIILEGDSRLWLLYHFFKLPRRDWGYLLETLTGGHLALERLVGSLIATLVIGRNRETFEVREEDAEKLFNFLWANSLLLPMEKSEGILRNLHEAVIYSDAYWIFNRAAIVYNALEKWEEGEKRFKTFCEAETVLQALESSVQAVIAYKLSGTGIDFSILDHPVNSHKKYALLLEKLKHLLRLEMEIHRVVEEICWYVTDTLLDLLRGYRIQRKKKISSQEKGQLKEIARRNHLLADERNFIAYAPDRCYIGRELQYFPGDAHAAAHASLKIQFSKKTQQVKKDYITPPQRIRRELSKRCGRYGRLVGDLHDKQQGTILQGVKMIWNPPKIQITDLRYKSAVTPRTLYDITVTSAEPRKARERWE